VLVCLVTLVAAAVENQNRDRHVSSADISMAIQLEDPEVDQYASEVTVEVRKDKQRLSYGGYSGPYGGYGQRGNFGGVRG
jgi:hypothetical protein